MKKLLITICFLFVLYSCGETGPSAEVQAKVKIVMSKESTVKDYVLTEANVLYIAVIDDGTKRNGLAEYYCQQMKDIEVDVFKVKIIKFGSQKDPKRDNVYGILLGEVQCN